jgi:hypothetical protein
MKIYHCDYLDISYSYDKEKKLYQVFEHKTNSVYYIFPKEKRNIKKNIILKLRKNKLLGK